MSTRTSAIPAMTAMALSTTGCSALDPIKGDWEMVSYDGEDAESDGVEGSMSLEMDGGEIVGEFEMSYYGYDLDGEVEGEKTDKDEYEFDVELEFGEDYGNYAFDFKMECELDGDELDCDEDRDGYEIVFERD